MRLWIGIDADDGASLLREHVSAIALAAGHVDNAQTAHAGGDPFVDDEVAAEPVVLLWHVWKRALAGERQRRHPLRLIALLEVS
jgi:hypothetical protein